MVFDLARAMRRKEEFESARLADFDFRRRARATRALARSLGVVDAAAATLVASVPEDEVPTRLAELAGVPVKDVVAAYRTCVAQAHAALVAERGDPTPHRLA